MEPRSGSAGALSDMGGNRGSLGAPEAPHSQRAARLSTGLARGSPADPPRPNSAGSRSGCSVAATGARLLRSPTAAGRGSGAGFLTPRGPTHPARGAGGRTSISGRDLGAGTPGHAGRRPADHGAISGARPARWTKALQTPEDGAGPSRRDARTVDLRHLRVHAGLPEHREAERRLAVDVARPPRHGRPRGVPGPSRAPGDAGVGVPARRFPAGGRGLPRGVPDGARRGGHRGECDVVPPLGPYAGRPDDAGSEPASLGDRGEPRVPGPPGRAATGAPPVRDALRPRRLEAGGAGRPGRAQSHVGLVRVLLLVRHRDDSQAIPEDGQGSGLVRRPLLAPAYCTDPCGRVPPTLRRFSDTPRTTDNTNAGTADTRSSGVRTPDTPPALPARGADRMVHSPSASHRRSDGSRGRPGRSPGR